MGTVSLLSLPIRYVAIFKRVAELMESACLRRWPAQKRSKSLFGIIPNPWARLGSIRWTSLNGSVERNGASGSFLAANRLTRDHGHRVGAIVPVFPLPALLRESPLGAVGLHPDHG